MTNKCYYDWQEIENLTQDLIREINLSHWRPDYIVGITRGGLVPANLISQYLDVPMYSLDVKLRDHTAHQGPESNLWMAEDAFGYIPEAERTEGPFETGTMYSDPTIRKQILIVDDINDSGATINWIKDDWQSGCLPNDPAWDDIWGNDVRFATLINNTGSDAEVEYSADEINKIEEPDLWIVFPWENWWSNK